MTFHTSEQYRRMMAGESAPGLRDLMAQQLDYSGGVEPTPASAALDASITTDGRVLIRLEQNGQGVSVTLEVREFLAFCTGGVQIVGQYYEHGLMERQKAGNARRIITR